jgi:hypothetical protein
MTRFSSGLSSSSVIEISPEKQLPVLFQIVNLSITVTIPMTTA